MKRFRLSTLMLLIVIAALAVALVVQDQRAARREAEQRELAAGREADLNAINDAARKEFGAMFTKMNSKYMKMLMDKDVVRAVARGRSTSETTGGKGRDQK